MKQKNIFLSISFILPMAVHLSSAQPINIINNTKLNTEKKDTTKRDSSTIKLLEVVVTAKQKSGPTTTSIIGRDAMQHLQPTSIADLMELLPGGYAKDPNMSQANTINLRETGTMNAYGVAIKNQNYNITSLGTQFIVDGVPIQTDANLQYSPLSSLQSTTTGSSTEDVRNTTNAGVDMRTISTDDIEQVEVIRGIPSVEYGNLTSGLVNIKKIRKSTPLCMRFKADGYSKLFALGKGLALGKDVDELGFSTAPILNVDLGYLDSKQDPTDNLENYKRVNASIRLTHKKILERTNWKWESAIDYTGSFDNSKEDPDLNYGRIDEYESSYNRWALTNNLTINFTKSWFRQINVNTAVSQQFDKLEETLLVAPQRYGIVPTSYNEGEQEVKAVYNEYIANYLCDGKPFNAYIKAKTTMRLNAGIVKNNIKGGINWELSKNFGKGQVYDLNYPLSLTGWSSRPRKYSDIPAVQNLSLFIEDEIRIPFGEQESIHDPKGGIEAMVGARFNSMPGMDSKYSMAGRIYTDPRVSTSIHIPHFILGDENVKTTLTAGYGMTSKMPTMQYLYPDP
ncbi:MAG: TonB-dependent receptor plug domain-containing protein, partial [Bacteroidaceae bacterium]|nr:TonB-dependent receptor plug domain-containing protein [Bacteroidaceae bacterium]